VATDTNPRPSFRFPGLLILTLLVAVLIGCQPASKANVTGDVPSFEGKLAVVVLDVGQADSILVVTPSGKTALIDAGNSQDDADKVILPYLRKNRIQRLDYLVLTHPHQDHVGGMPEILKNVDVTVAAFSGEPSTNSTYQQFLSIVRQHNMRALEARRGKSLDLGPDVQAAILNPPEQFFEDTNDNSVVIRLAWRDVSALLMGDAGAEAEKSILESGAKVRSTILKVGHHGSSTSSTARFLDAVKPQYAVISVGAGNEYGHPAQRTLDALARRNVTTFRTDKHGSVTLLSDGREVAVTTQKQ